MTRFTVIYLLPIRLSDIQEAPTPHHSQVMRLSDEQEAMWPRPIPPRPIPPRPIPPRQAGTDLDVRVGEARPPLVHPLQ